LLLAGLLASGAFGMVSVAGSDATSTGGDTTSTATDAAPPATDTSTGASTTTTPSTDASTTDTTPTTTEAPPAGSTPAPTTTPSIFTPSIASDQQDYNPGAPVTLTGHGWSPGDVVHVFVNDDVGQTWAYAVDATADATGSFTLQFALPDWFVADYSVTATGSAGAVATTAFTDSAVQNVTVTVSPTAAGANATYTIKFTPTNTTSQKIQVTFPTGTTVPAAIAAGNITVNGSAAPAASYSINVSQRQIQFDAPAELPANVQATVVIGATSAVIGNPPAGTYTLQLKTKDDNNQADSANYAIVGVKSTTTSLTSSANPSTYPAGVTFTATVVANPAPNPNGAGTVTFKDGGATLCNAVALSGNTATCTPSPALAAGSHSITADYSGTANFAASSASLTQNVNKGNQTISFAQPASPAAYGASFAINPTASSGLAVAVSVTGPCAYNSSLGTVSMSGGSGTCAITASQPGDANYNAAPAVIRNVEAAKANQTIAVTTHAPSSAAYNSSFTVTASTSSGLPVSLTGSGACSNNGATFTMTSGSGACTVKYDQAGDANYNAAAQITESVSATKANQTINITTHAPATAAYNSSFTVAANGGGSGNPVSFSSSGACSNNGATFTMTSGSGTCTVKYDQAGDANYNAASQASETVNAAKINQTINFGSLAPKTYGDADFAVGATSTSGLAVSFSALGSCTFVLGQVHLTGAGTCTITASQAGDDNYNAADAVPQSFTMARATLKIAANDASKVYGAANPTFTGSIQGVVFPDSVTLTLDSPATGRSPVGTYAIVPHANAAADVLANYDVQATNGTLTITPKPITVKADPQSKMYGSADPQLSYQVTSGSLEQGDTLSGSLSRDPGESVAGSPYAIKRGSLTAGNNYDLSYEGANLTITPKPITLAADDKTMVYGSPDPALTVTVPDGALEYGDSVSGSLERASGNDVGSYAITKGTLSAGGNYDLTVTPGTLTITKKPITVAADDKSKTYGDADPALTVSVPAGALEQGDSLSGELTREPGQNVGSYSITKGTLSAGGNYDLTVTPGTLTITQKAASLTAEDKSKAYGSADPALTTVDSGFLAGDLGAGKITFSVSRAAGESVAGSPYTITPAASDGTTGLLGNYDITIKTGQLTITKKAITGSFVAADKVYDGNTDAIVTSRDLSGAVSGDAVSLAGGSAAFDTRNAGTAKIVTLTGATLAGADAGNYTLDSVATAKANITPKPITVKADDKAKVYGSADPAPTVTTLAGALESGDSLSGSLVRAPGNNVGTYEITRGTLTAGSNYDLTVTPGTLTITKKTITVKADDKTKVYGSADPALTVTTPFGALESGDSLSGSLVRAPGNNVGDYAIIKGTLTAGGNYDLTVTPGTFTITKKPITVTADPQTKVTGASDPVLTYKVPTGSLESGDSFSGALIRAPGEAVGTYTITQGTLTAGANYDLTFVGSTLKIVYGWDGFLQPINDTAHQTGVLESKFKLGQTIPAKFVLKNAAGAVVRQVTEPTFSRSGNLGVCDSNATPETTDLVNPDSGVTYTWDGSQYHYNWSIKNLTAGEYRIYANLADGTKPYVDICLTK
jgi:hypothetical protein